MLNPDQVLSVAQMRAAEDKVIAAGSSVEALMAIAGRGAAEWVWRIAGRQRVTVLCGPGNNGGDGYVIAQTLLERGVDAAVIQASAPRTPAAIWAMEQFTGLVLPPDAERSGDVFVDCLFGSGLSRPLLPEHVALLVRLAGAHRYSIAVDVPSGVDADSGGLLATTLPRFDATLALGAWKYAHFFMPSAALMGDVKRVDIGIEAWAGAAQMLRRPALQAPEADAHKYRRGLVAVVGGAMMGASALASEASARGGAGYVRLIADEPVRVSHAVVQFREGSFEKAKSVLVGQGLGRDERAQECVARALQSGVPVVADADALWHLAQVDRESLPAPAIVTPHDGEFARLFGHVSGSKVERARQAAIGGSVVIYKGADTVIAAPDGRTALCPRASSWLSTAGTGDVLAGLCASRLAIAGDPFTAACEAVWLHSEAARLAGPAFAADDLIHHIPQAIANCL